MPGPYSERKRKPIKPTNWPAVVVVMTRWQGVVGRQHSPPETVIPRRGRRAQEHRKMKMSLVNKCAGFLALLLLALLLLIVATAAVVAAADKNDHERGHHLSFTVDHLLSLLELDELAATDRLHQAKPRPAAARTRRAHDNNNNNNLRYSDFGPFQQQFNFGQPNKWWHPRQQQATLAAAGVASRLQQQQQTGSHGIITDQPPSELMFSNQTGALVHCGVAFELAQGIARANSAHHQRNLSSPGGQRTVPSGAGQLPMIQIRWEKENGDELEKILYATQADSSSSASDDENPNRPLLRHVRPTDGALVFEPFRALDFRSDVHSATYRCVAETPARPGESQVGVSTTPVISPGGASGQPPAPHASAVSRDMRVRAVLAEPAQAYAIEVLDELALEGNSVTFRCQVPGHASAFLQVVEWIESPGEIAHSVQQSRDSMMMLAAATGSGGGQNHTTHLALAKLAAQRYFVSPRTGELTILEVDSGFNERTYRCRCRNKLTGELVSSISRGKLIVSESRAPIAPKLVAAAGYSSNQQVGVQFFDPSTAEFVSRPPSLRYPPSQQQVNLPQLLTVGEDEQVALLVCRLQAFPRAQISWFKQVVPAAAADSSQEVPPLAQLPLPVTSLRLGYSQQAIAAHNQTSISDHQTASLSSTIKYIQLSNVLLVRHLNRNDSGQYLCLARNAAGEERSTISLQVTGRLRTRLSVSASVLELGKSLALECSVSGWPIHQLVFKHNTQVIKSVSGPDAAAVAAVAQQEGGGSRAQVAVSNHLFATPTSTTKTPGGGSANYFVLDENGGNQDGATAEAGDTSNGSDNQQQQQQVAEDALMSHVIVIVLEPQHAGAYQCFAHNQFESAQSTAYLRVLDDPPTFKETFTSQVHTAGADVSLHCSARANPLPEITWTIDEQPLASVESAYNRIRFGDFVTRDNLVISYVNISQVQVADGGLYRCTADNRLARITHEALVQVWGEPLVKPMPNVTVLASTTFRQRCPVAGHPVGEIQWHHDGHRLPANHRQRVHDNGTLEVEHMEKSAGDEGEYTCVAIGGGGGGASDSGHTVTGGGGELKSRVLIASSTELPPLPATAADRRVEPGGGVSGGGPPQSRAAQGSVHVSIRVRPTIEPFAVSRQLREGQRASIMCTISSGDLPISITWFLNDQLLLPISSGGGGVGDQLVSSPSSSSSGQVAILWASSTSKRPIGLSHHPNHHHQMPIISGQLQSSEAATSQQLLAGVQISRVSDYSSTLLFESLLARHTGNYTCLARNDAGSVSHSAPMVVQVAPKWSIEPNDTRIVRGRASSIDCMASGFPPPRVIWTKATGDFASMAPDANGKQLVDSMRSSTPAMAPTSSSSPSSSSSSSSNHLGTWRSIVSSPHLQVFENGSLNVLDARDADHGHYMCQASNGVGPGLSKVIRVTINVAAQFVTRHAVQYVARGELTQLKCQAKGDWPVALTWFKNGRHKLEPVNPQGNPLAGRMLQHGAPNGADGPNHLLLSSTTASVLASLDNTQQPVNSSRRESLAHQLGAWFSFTGENQQESASSQGGSGGVLMQRYTMASSEHLVPGAPSISVAHVQHLREAVQQAERQAGGSPFGLVAQVRNTQQQQQPVVVQLSSTLTIEQAERQDMGTYRCLAGNQFGLDERLIQLIVQEPPDRIEELSVLDVQSRSATLVWWAPYDGNAPIQNYHIQYKPANSPSSSSSSSGLTSSGSTLPAGHAQHHHRGHAHSHHQDETGPGGWLNYTVAAASSAAAAAGAAGSSVEPGAAAMVSAAQKSALASERILNKVTIGSLKPVTHYYFRLEAENKLGRGHASSIIGKPTLEEAPGAAPGKLKAVAQSSSSILVSWNKLQEREVFGSTLGYYVAYRRLPVASTSGSDTGSALATSVGQMDQAVPPLLGEQVGVNLTNANQATQDETLTTIYKPVAHDEKLSKFDALLTGLKRSTRYAISVQAFNGRGTGPASEPVVVRTLELDLPRQMKLFVKQATNSSIRLEWRPLAQAALAVMSRQPQQDANATSSPQLATAAAGDVVDYYSLFQAELGGEEQPRWQEARLPGHASNHLIEQLKCGTRYQFYAMGSNRIGRGEQSEILDTKTAGGEPMAPDRQSCFDVINTTCYAIRLDHWQDNGCPLRRFDVRYRLEPLRDWIHLAHFDLQQAEPMNSATGMATTTTTGGGINATTSAPRNLFKRSIAAVDESGEFAAYPDAEQQGGAEEDELAFIDYLAPGAGATSGDDDGSQQPLDYLALEAASLISKDDARTPASAGTGTGAGNDAQLFSLLKDSMLPAFRGDEAQSHDTLAEPEKPGTHIRRATGMPQVAREWQASNFVLENAKMPPEDDDVDARIAKSRPVLAITNWRRVHLCNLKPDSYYTVQIRAENRVGETEAEYRLLTSPEGLEFDSQIKRHVVSSRLDASSDRMTASGPHSAMGASNLGNLVGGFNQWPWLVPASLIMTLITIVIIIGLLLKNRSTSFGADASGRGGGCAGGSSPDSSSASSTTTTTATANPGGGGGGGGHNLVQGAACTLQRRLNGGYLEHQHHTLHHPPAPSSTTGSFAPPAQHHLHHHHTLHHPVRTNTNMNLNMYHHHNNTMRQYSGRSDPASGVAGSDLMLTSAGGAPGENYATVVAGPARHPTSLFANTANQFEAMNQQRQQQFEDTSSVAMAAAAAANEMALADIYQQRAQVINQQQQVIYGATGNNHLSESNGDRSPYGGLMLHNMPTLANGSDRTQTTSGVQATTGSPSTTAPLSSINSTSTGSGGGGQTDHFHHHMMATTLPPIDQDSGSRVYLCASGKDQEEEEEHQHGGKQEASIFYGMPQLDEQQQQQVDNYNQESQDNMGQFFALQHQQQGNNQQQQVADDCLAFDPVYATIRRTFPQAFKYLTLQHKPGTGPAATASGQQQHQ